MRIWEIAKGEAIQKITFPGTPIRLAFSPDERSLAVSTSSMSKNEVSIRDLVTGQETLKLELGQGPPLALAFSPKGNLLAASFDRVLIVWELSERKASVRT